MSGASFVLSPYSRVGDKPTTARFLTTAMLPGILVPLLLSTAPQAKAAEGRPATRQATAQDEGPAKRFGDKDLTDDADSITNDKTVDLTADVDFGGGDDGLINNGVITIGANAKDPLHVTFKSLEGFRNNKLIDLRNGHGGDVLTVSGAYRGADARLGLDIAPSGADRLEVGGVANGKTLIVLGGVDAKSAFLTKGQGLVLVKAGKDSVADAFEIENQEIGFIRYGLTFDASDGSYRLTGGAGQRVYDGLKLSEGATNVWRQSADAWSAHAANLRDGAVNADGDPNEVGPGVWAQTFGQRMDRNDTVKVGDRGVATDYQQTSYGGQLGVDLINGSVGETSLVLGVTAGYADAKQRFNVVDDSAKFQVFNVGGYLSLSREGYFLNAMAKADHHAIKVRGAADAIDDSLKGVSWGGQVEAGTRLEGDGLAYEHLLSISYVSTRLNDLKALDQRLDFGDSAGFVAKAGVRGSVEADALGGTLTSYGAAFVAYDFTIKNSLDFRSGDQVERLSRDGGRTFGQITLGAAFRTAGSATAFLEASGDFGGGRRGGGLRLGTRMGF